VINFFLLATRDNGNFRAVHNFSLSLSLSRSLSLFVASLCSLTSASRVDVEKLVDRSFLFFSFERLCRVEQRVREVNDVEFKG